MRTRIIAVLNQKGGVGKTTTCVSLGAALARRGHRVLLIDMDPQSNLTVHLGADTRTLRKSTYSLLLGEHPLGPAVLTTGDPNLRFVPATLALANAEIQLASAVGRELLLREAIEVWLEDETAGEPAQRADFVFIDCPPSLGILTMNALCAANEVLLPIQAEFFALQGIAGILESLKAVQRLNRGLQLSMVVPCMVDKRKTLAREVMEEVDKYFGKLVTRTRIRNNVKLAEAPSHGMTIFEYAASSNGAKDYESLAREVLGEPIDVEAAPAVAAVVPCVPWEPAAVGPAAVASATVAPESALAVALPAVEPLPEVEVAAAFVPAPVAAAIPATVAATDAATDAAAPDAAPFVANCGDDAFESDAAPPPPGGSGTGLLAADDAGGEASPEAGQPSTDCPATDPADRTTADPAEPSALVASAWPGSTFGEPSA